ncbi:MAG: winged helix-turn-helix transcriptional regulator [Klenkia sp.]|nr:winged helix-turn-helix transcriptional regulator [Klenkia sp.]
MSEPVSMPPSVTPVPGAADPRVETGSTTAPVYSAPAVDKALDVLELLSLAPSPLSQNQIAHEVGRSVSQIFRVLTVLERRGYIARDPESGLYSLTMAMFDVAHRKEPIRTLVALAHGPMQRLAEEVMQSCNLGYRTGSTLTIVAEAAGAWDFGFRVRVGATFPLLPSTSGLVLLAHAGDLDPADPALPSTDEDTLRTIRAQGFWTCADETHPGILDMAAPVTRRDGSAVAVLTVPYVATSYSKVPADAVRGALVQTAAQISTRLSGSDR